jgi:predicted Zn-dependent protease
MGVEYRWVRWGAWACLLASLAACDRMERAKDFLDEYTTLGDQSHVQLVSREVTDRMAGQWYPAALQELANKGHKLDEDPETVNLVNDIAIKIARQAIKMYPLSEQWDWQLHVVTADDVNAWCMAGGRMVVYTGLVNQVQGNPHKIAAVMGHEIAHALLEHTRQNLTRDMLLSSGLWIASKSLKVGAVRSEQIRQDMHVAFRPINREYEREADALGLELMTRAGYDPVIGGQIWRDMDRQHDSVGAQRLAEFMSDHPMSAERLAALTALAEKLKKHPAAGGNP